MKKTRWLWAVAAIAVMLAGAAIWALTHPAEGSRGVLYRVTHGQSEMYLLGSIHIGSRGMYPFGEAIQKAMQSSDTFVYECDTTSPDATGEMKARMALPEGQTLRDAIGESLYAEVERVCQQQGINLDTLNKLKPWAVINTLAVYTTAAEMGVNNVNEALSLGVEKQVEAYGKQNHKKTAYLETLTQQVDALEGFSDSLKRYLLQSECDVILAPENAKGMDATIAQWPEWWRVGNVEAFASNYLATYLEPGNEAVCAEYHRKLVTERNLRMAERLSDMLESGGSWFVTVGLLHLALPEDSVVTLLRQQGYTVELISNP